MESQPRFLQYPQYLRETSPRDEYEEANGEHAAERYLEIERTRHEKRAVIKRQNNPELGQ